MITILFKFPVLRYCGLCGLLALLWSTSAVAQDLRAAIQTRVWEEPPEIEVNNALVSYRFSKVGGTLSSAYLHFTAPWGAPPVEVLADTTVSARTSLQGEKLFARLYAEDAHFPFALTLGPLKTLYQAELLPSENPKIQRVKLIHQEGNLRVEKIFTIVNEPSYLVSVEVRLENLSTSEALSFPEGFQLALGRHPNNPQHPAPIQVKFLFDGVRSLVPLRNYTHFEGLGFFRNDLVLWLTNDPQQTDIHPWVSEDARPVYGVRSSALTLTAGESRVYRFRLYAGRAHHLFLEEAGLVSIVDSNLWDQALAILTKSLQWLYEQTGNYGWALILLTLIIRVLMYPLTRAQFHSMAKMKEIQPKIEKLQARYPALTQLKVLHPKMSEDELKRRARENREELTKKQMELFRKAGANPMSGCLPALLQIPILILLWRVVLHSAELIHLSPGFLWMNDLSQPDALYLIVALTVLAQIAQGKLTPSPGSGQNQMLIWVFPILFGFLLKDLSAGLWLHYFISTSVQVTQQAIVLWELRRKSPLKLEEPEPEAVDGAPKH